MNSQPSVFTQAALAYAQQFRLPVFPLKPRGKVPLSPNGFKNATIDPHIIGIWGTNWSDANVGIPTGTTSGFDVLDIDPRHGGDESLKELIRSNGPLPETVEALTGGGGRHLLFKHEEGIRNSAGQLPGLDIRGDGGYIAAPPSIHENGQKYAWELSSRIGEVEMAEWPLWLLEALQAGKGKTEECALGIEEHIPEGQRNTALASFAGTLRNRGLDKAEMLHCLQGMNESRCRPPLPDEELRHISTSFEQYAPGSLLPTVSSPDVSPTRINGDSSTVASVASNLVAAPLGGQRQQQGYTRQTMDDLRRAYRPTEWLIDKIVPVPGTVLIAGVPGIGKTWLVLSAAIAVAMGRPWLSHFKSRQGAVLLVLEEEDSSSVVERMSLLYGGMGLSQEQGDKLPIEFFIQQGVSLLASDGSLTPELRRHIEEVQPTLIGMDPFRRLHGSDENDSGAMSHLFSKLRGVTQLTSTPCSLLLVHHLRKRTLTDSGLDRVRGSSDIGASVDSVLEIDGEFDNMLKLRHAKSKRGPTLGLFLMQPEIKAEMVKLKYMDAVTQAETNQQATRSVILEALGNAPLNQSQLLASVKKRNGPGRSRTMAAVNEMVNAEALKVLPGKRKDEKIYALPDLVADRPAPPVTTRCDAEEIVVEGQL